MPITHVTIPVPPAKVGETEWAEAHTLPTATEIGALTTASAAAMFLTPDSASAIYLLKQDASTTYARQASAVTTAQLGVYLLSNDASTTYARQASAVTTAQLSVYLTSASAESIYLLKQDASTTYARQASAVTTAQLSVYLTSGSAEAIYLLKQDASTTYARQTSAVTTAQLAVYLLSQDASTTYARQASAVTTANANATYAVLAHSHSAGAVTTEVFARERLGSASASIGVYLRGDGQWAPVSVINITEASADAKYLTSASADFQYGRYKYVATDVTNATTVVTTLNDLIITCSASTVYALEGHLIWRSSAATTGISIQCSTTPTPGMYSFGVMIHGFGADGIAGNFFGYASTNADPITCTSANAAPLNYPLVINGTIITPGSTSFIQLCVASEVSNSGIVIRRGSWVRAIRLGAA